MTDEPGFVAVQGARVPELGLGTWKLEGETCYDAVSTALELGYRHVDTAQLYGNEREVGDAIRDSPVDREDVFLTTKVSPKQASYRGVLRSTARSLERLGTSYVDLLLLHWPNPLVDVADTTRAMAALRDQGKIRHAGVSNFSKRRLKKVRQVSPVPILTDQVQFHPFDPKRDLLRYCQDYDTMLTAYSPLAHGGILDDDVLGAIGATYDASAAQVAIRWASQHHNVAVIPKASSREHLEANLEAFAFTLSSDEMERIARPSKLKTGALMLRSQLGG
jgi:2,5-diketo-D-gluconate reductase B